MNIEIDKSESEMISFLRANGYTVKEEEHTICHSVYHNDVEYEKIKLWAVYKNGKKFLKFRKESWLEDSFEAVFSKKLYEIVKNYKF